MIEARKLMAYLDSRLGNHTGTGPEYQYHCFACVDRVGDESAKRKLWVNVTKGKAICYRCGYKAPSVRKLFLDMNSGHLRVEEIALLKGEVRTVELTQVRHTVLGMLYADAPAFADLWPVRLPVEFKMLSEHRGGLCRAGWSYLQGRGVHPDVVAECQLGFCAAGDYGQRIIFPVFQHGKVVYFTNRSVIHKHPIKSKNPPNVAGHFTKDHCLLGYDQCVGAPRVALVEGPFSWLGCIGNGMPALCLMGKTMSPVQEMLVGALVAHGLRELVVSLDADAEAWKIYTSMLGRVPSVTVLPLEYGDPDDRKADLPDLMEERRALSVRDRVVQKLRHEK